MTRKRSRDEVEGANLLGVGDTIAWLNGAVNEQQEGSNATADSTGERQNNGEGGSTKKRKTSAKKDSQHSYPSISHSPHARLQTFVKIGDLQNLILYLIADGTAPQWCSVQNHTNVKKVVALMVPGLDAGMFDGSIPLTSSTAADSINSNEAGTKPSDGDTDGWTTVKHGKSKASPDDYYPVKLLKNRLPEAVRPFGEMFSNLWPIKTPGDEKYAKMHSPLAALLTVPIVKPKDEKKMKGPQPPANRNHQNQRTPITEFLASTEELVDDGYTIHPAHFANSPSAEAETARRAAAKTTVADGWADTLNIADLSAGAHGAKDNEQGALTAGRKVLAMDCEMCITSPPGETPQVFSLTRVSIVDWDGKVVLDELVKPDRPITNYLTAYSGITPSMLENVSTSLQDIQRKLLSILTPDTIVVGHSLNSDLNALQLTHPYIVDTALLFPHPRGPPLKSSLKWLCQKYLSREIQKGHGSTGHNSIEDAKATLDLVKLKCEKGKAWGTSEANSESFFKRLSRSTRPKQQKAHPAGDDEHRATAIVDWGVPSRGYGGQADVTIGCESDGEVVAGVKRALGVDAANDTLPKGGCDFIWGRFRELEAHRGWWDKSKLVDADALRTSTAGALAGRSLATVVAQTTGHIREIYDALPPCSVLIVYSGSADPRELREMQELQQKFKDEYRVKKWDQLSVQWTDVEEQKLRKACETARRGIGFITVK